MSEKNIIQSILNKNNYPLNKLNYYYSSISKAYPKYPYQINFNLVEIKIHLASK